MSFDSLMIHSINVLRRNGSSDGAGGFTLEFAPIASGIKGRIRPASSSEINLGDRWDAAVSHVAYMRPRDVRRDDRLQLGDIIFRVIAVQEPSRMGHHLEVMCQQIQIKEPDDYGEIN